MPYQLVAARGVPYDRYRDGHDPLNVQQAWSTGSPQAMDQVLEHHYSSHIVLESRWIRCSVLGDEALDPLPDRER